VSTVVLASSDVRWRFAVPVGAALVTFVAASTIIANLRPVPATVLIVWAFAVVAPAIVDLTVGRLPDVIVLPALAVVSLGATAAQRPAGAIAGALVFGLPMLVTHVLRPDGLGFGDVKYATLLGFGLGVVGAPLVVPAYVLAALLHGVVCLALRSGRRLVPFGPALAVASTVTLSAGLLGRA
jgi:leader peptidase (prepilin peptidase)/N-methyltransferase